MCLAAVFAANCQHDVSSVRDFDEPGDCRNQKVIRRAHAKQQGKWNETAKVRGPGQSCEVVGQYNW